MSATLRLRNISATKRLVRRDALEDLANRICAGENIDTATEISLLLCDDEFISGLNRQYRSEEGPTDVLSFEQDASEGGILGDIVISLETALRRCDEDRALARKEVDILFCHGLLHLLGYEHSTQAERETMTRKQARYLRVSEDAAWPSAPARHGKIAAPMQAAWR